MDLHEFKANSTKPIPGQPRLLHRETLSSQINKKEKKKKETNQVSEVRMGQVYSNVIQMDDTISPSPFYQHKQLRV